MVEEVGKKGTAAPLNSILKYPTTHPLRIGEAVLGHVVRARGELPRFRGTQPGDVRIVGS